MNFIKKLSNLLFGTRYHLNIEKFQKPSNDKVTLNYFQQAEKRNVTASGERWND